MFSTRGPPPPCWEPPSSASPSWARSASTSPTSSLRGGSRWWPGSSRVARTPNERTEPRPRVRLARRAEPGHDSREKASPLLWSMRDGRERPWGMGWQMNERHTEWASGARARLLVKVLARRLGTDEDDVEGRLASLFLLVPPMQRRIETVGEEMAAALLEAPDAVAGALLCLREELADADVAQFASAVPEVLLWPRERIRGSLQDSCRHMGGDARVLSRVAAVAPVLCVRPDALASALAEIQRLLGGSEADTLARVAASPGLLLQAMGGASILGPGDVLDRTTGYRQD